MQFEEIVARLNRAGGHLQTIPEYQRDDTRAVQVEVFKTRHPGLFVKVLNSPDLTIAGLYIKNEDGIMVSCDRQAHVIPDDAIPVHDEMWDRFYCSSVGVYKHEDQPDREEQMVEFTSFVARTLS